MATANVSAPNKPVKNKRSTVHNFNDLRHTNHCKDCSDLRDADFRLRVEREVPFYNSLAGWILELCEQDLLTDLIDWMKRVQMGDEDTPRWRGNGMAKYLMLSELIEWMEWGAATGTILEFTKQREARSGDWLTFYALANLCKGDLPISLGEWAHNQGMLNGVPAWIKLQAMRND
jgi:hypothetical protein